MYLTYFKRIIDSLLASMILILFSPFFLLLVILLIMVNKDTPFYLQRRPGLYGKIFKLIKFKTMTDACDSNGELLPDALRLTTLGKIIRKFSLDELPQLINVIRGDMSLIGPRPLLVEYLHLYSDHQKRRHLVKPGISGWAQVNGRNTTTWKERFELDVWYIDNATFIVDLKILFLTMIKIIKSEGVNQNKSVSMEKFTGQ